MLNSTSSRRRSWPILIALIGLLGSVPTIANDNLVAPTMAVQTTIPIVAPDAPILLAWNSQYRQQDVSWRALINGNIHHNFASSSLTVTEVPITNCPGLAAPAICYEYQTSIPGVPRGQNYQLLVRVHNELGQADSNIVAFHAGVEPTVPPNGLRIRTTTVAETVLNRSTGAVLHTSTKSSTEVEEIILPAVTAITGGRR